MTTDDAIPNFYSLLGLNPDEPWDEAKFESVLRDKRNEWSRQSSGAAEKTLVAKRNLELIPEIRRIMADPVLRSLHAASAKIEYLKPRRELLQKHLMLVQAKGFLEETELDSIIETFKDVLSKEEICSHITVPVHVSGTHNGLLHITSTLHICITEEPLTAQNFTTIISALTELSTKYWLIAKKRFADLIEYTQTHNGQFVEEANVVVTRITYNSPMNMHWKVDLSAPSVAEALVTTIDGITQIGKRLEKAELENQTKAQEIKLAEQHADQELQLAALERDKQVLEVEQRCLEVLEKRLEVQKKGIEYALEVASKVVDTLHPDADPATRAMEIQILLPNLIQLQNGKGLELALSVTNVKE